MLGKSGIVTVAAALLLAGCGGGERVVTPEERTVAVDLVLAGGAPTAVRAAEGPSVPFGEPVTFVLRVRNADDAPLTLHFGSSQTHDFTVSDASAAPVWRWSHDMAFLTVLTDLEFAPGETRSFSVTWDQRDDEGRQVPRGTYEVVGSLPVAGSELRSEPVVFRIE